MVYDYREAKADDILNKYRIFTDEQIVEFFNVINNETNEYTRLKDYIIYTILFYTGCTFDELSTVILYKDRSALVNEDKGNYVILSEKLLSFEQPLRSFTLPDELVRCIYKFNRLIESTIPQQKIKNVCPLFCKNKKDSYIALDYAHFRDRMKRIRSKLSYSDEKLSNNNIRYTVVKKLLQIYDVKEVAGIVGMHRCKVCKFKEMSESVSCGTNYCEKHPILKIIEG